MIQERILELTEYGLVTGLVEPEDRRFTINRLLELFHLDELEDEVAAVYAKRTPMTQESAEAALEGILNEMLDYAAEDGLMPEDTITYRDLFDTKIMSMLVPRPSEVIKKFQALYQISPKEATDYFYKLSRDTNYIRRYRIKKDQKWTADTEFGTLDITINLSKPEKDPKAIAAAKLAKQSGYPKCLLCKENEGYAGRVNHPARQNHRIIPVTINHSDWFFQYSPYVYYNEHCIVFNAEHTPMKIEKATFGKLLDFVEQFPHYFVGSNADLPIVGGSILSHDHFQGGHYTFAMAKAEIEKHVTIPGYEDVEAGIVKWPLSVLRIRSKDEKRLIDLATHVLENWRGYTDEAAFVFAETDEEPHNTITPIARKVDDTYELDLTLRNNITTEENPLGVYHPHACYHHIKKENIGLIEVMGLAVLPARLKEELELVNCYVDIQKIRFNDKFSYTVDLQEGLEECVIPKLIIQPIVENSVLHGLKESEEGNILVRITEQEDVLCIEVTDDGCGAPEEWMDAINHRRQEQLVGHIGVSNVDTIIRLTYGEEYGIHMESLTLNAENPTDGQRTEEEGEVHGTKVTLRLPVRYGEA